MKELITHKELKEILSYDPDTGVFIRIKSRKGASKGAIAGCLNPHGYRRISINHRLYYEHRLAWFYVYGEWPKQDIDHINHKTDDNRIVNLRELNRSENNQNRAKTASKVGLIGVSYCPLKGRYTAKICINYKRINLGSYKNKEEAQKAYLNGKSEFHKYGNP